MSSHNPRRCVVTIELCQESSKSAQAQIFELPKKSSRNYSYPCVLCCRYFRYCRSPPSRRRAPPPHIPAGQGGCVLGRVRQRPPELRSVSRGPNPREAPILLNSSGKSPSPRFYETFLYFLKIFFDSNGSERQYQCEPLSPSPRWFLPDNFRQQHENLITSHTTAGEISSE